jgi:4a-hydroxytetrahydrobiopterin dehydratase
MGSVKGSTKISPRVVELSSQMCRELAPGSEAMSPGAISLLIGDFPGWENLANCEIAKTFRFENFYETMAFVNALALVAHHQNHHPELEVSFSRARVRFSTHSVGGLSENDFICAAKIEAMLEQV